MFFCESVIVLIEKSFYEMIMYDIKEGKDSALYNKILFEGLSRLRNK